MRLLLGLFIIIIFILSLVASILCVRTNNFLEEIRQDQQFIRGDINFLMRKFSVLECNDRAFGDSAITLENKVATLDRILNLGVNY